MPLSPSFSLYWTPLFLRPSSFTYLPLSGALSLFQYSPAPVLSCPTPLPSSLRPVAHIGRGERNHGGHAFSLMSVRVQAEGEGEAAREGGRGRGRGNVTKRRRKRGWKRVRARQESFHCASKLMKRLVRWPQGLLTETEQHHTRNENLIFLAHHVCLYVQIHKNAFSRT